MLFGNRCAVELPEFGQLHSRLPHFLRILPLCMHEFVFLCVVCTCVFMCVFVCIHIAFLVHLYICVPICLCVVYLFVCVCVFSQLQRLPHFLLLYMHTTHIHACVCVCKCIQQQSFSQRVRGFLYVYILTMHQCTHTHKHTNDIFLSTSCCFNMLVKIWARCLIHPSSVPLMYAY